MDTRRYRQGLAAAKAGKSGFAKVPRPERTEFYHRNIVLARIFASSSTKWVLKGGTALIWRDPNARATRDIDIFDSTSDSLEKAVEDFRKALDEVSTAPYDVKLSCEVLSSNLVESSSRQTARLRVRLLSAAGQEIQTPIKIDLVVGCKITGQVESSSVDSLKAVLQDDFPDLQLYPIVDHLADKVAATMQTYTQSGQENQSTRVRDLIDIAHIAVTERIDGFELYTAIESERLERGLESYAEGLVCPDEWTALYAKERTKGKAPDSFEEALKLAQALINPAITGDAKDKIWNRDSWQ